MKITLPEQVEIDIPSSQTKTMLIVSGGRAPSLKWLKAIAPDKKICCVDHGIDACKAADILPDFLFGDNDSASSESWDWAETHNVTINKYPREKDLTDTQLALLQTAGNNVILTGAFGGRLDHLFSTYIICNTNDSNMRIRNDRNVIWIVPILIETDTSHSSTAR